MSKHLIGVVVTITSAEHGEFKNWGVVRNFDGDSYHVAMNDDPKTALIFDRNEFKVEKQMNTAAARAALGLPPLNEKAIYSAQHQAAQARAAKRKPTFKP